MNTVGNNFVPHSQYVNNAAQGGGLSAQMKGLQRTQDDESEVHNHREEAQLSKLAQQSIEQSRQQQEGKAAENARQSGADSQVMDDLHRDGSEENDVHERNRQAELGKTRDGRAVVPGQGPDGQRVSGNGSLGHEEAGVEIGEIGRRPEEVLADVPGHSAAFARGSVEAQLANPAQVDKLTEIKPLPDQQRVEADSPELQPVASLGPVLGDKETGEISHPSPLTEQRSPTTVPQEYDAEQMAHMERVVAEQQLARQNAGQEEMLIAGGLPGGQSGNGVAGPGAPARKEELAANFAQARNELVEATGDLAPYGWDSVCGQLLQKNNGNEQAAAFELRGMMQRVLTQDPGLAKIWEDSSRNPDGLKSFVDQSRQYIADNGHKHDPADVDAAGKMVTCFEKCTSFLEAGQAQLRETGEAPSQQRLEALHGKLFDSVTRAPQDFQREFKGEMGQLAQAGKLNETNASEVAGAVSANVSARQLQKMDVTSLWSPPGQTEEEAAEAARRAQAKKQQWLQEGVDGDLSDAMVFEQANWAAQKMQTQPNPQLAAYQTQVNDYIALNTVMRQGYAVSSHNPDYYEKSAYAQRA